MLNLSLTFLVVAIIAAAYGSGGVASGAAEIARSCLFLFAVAFAASLVWHLATERRSGRPV